MVLWNFEMQVWDFAEVKSGGQGLLVLRRLMKRRCRFEIRPRISSACSLLLVLLTAWVAVSFLAASVPCWLAEEEMVGVWSWD